MAIAFSRYVCLSIETRAKGEISNQSTALAGACSDFPAGHSCQDDRGDNRGWEGRRDREWGRVKGGEKREQRLCNLLKMTENPGNWAEN